MQADGLPAVREKGAVMPGLNESCAQRFAAIDIGTVTCRLLVADVDASGVHEVRRAHAITNLGEGVASSGVLLPAAMQRVDEQMLRFLDIIDECRDGIQGGIPLTAVATSAARDARNADEFTALLKKRGIELSVIPGEREAELSFKGASSSFPPVPLFVVDVGGGSTEIIAGQAGQAPQFRRSFDIGCRRVTELFLHDDPPAREELERARSWALGTFVPFFQTVREAGFKGQTMAAVAGTATSVVAMHLRLEHYDPRRVHLSVIDRETLDALERSTAAMPLAKRRTIPGLEPDRAPVIVAGLVILQAVLDAAGMESFTVSETDILHGIILDASLRHGKQDAPTV